MTHPSRQKFGTTAAGEQVERLTLDNGCLSCEIITFGAAQYYTPTDASSIPPGRTESGGGDPDGPACPYTHRGTH